MSLARVGAIGDVHGEDASLEQVLGFMQTQSLDAILCVGDIVDGHGDVSRCIDLLRQHDALTVSGNHERWFLQDTMRGLPLATTELGEAQREWVAQLPATRSLETPAGPLLLCHGVGDDDMAVLRPDTKGYALQALDGLRPLMLDESVRFMLGGHTHMRMVRGFQGLTVINAGTLHREFDAGFLIIDFDRREVSTFDVGTATATETLPLP